MGAENHIIITPMNNTINIRPKNPVNNEFTNLIAGIIALFAVSFLGMYDIIIFPFYENIPSAFKIH
jgi:hypothetical protein